MNVPENEFEKKVFEEIKKIKGSMTRLKNQIVGKESYEGKKIRTNVKGVRRYIERLERILKKNITEEVGLSRDIEELLDRISDKETREKVSEHLEYRSKDEILERINELREERERMEKAKEEGKVRSDFDINKAIGRKTGEIRRLLWTLNIGTRGAHYSSESPKEFLYHNEEREDER